MGQKWYIDKIKVAAPELLDGDTADIMDWIDNAFAIYAEDEDTAAKMDDAIKEQEDYYGVEIDYMSRTQLLTVVAKLIDVTGGENNRNGNCINDAPTYAQEQLVDIERRKEKAVNHPSYYKRGGVEAIDAIEAWGLGFHLGNVVKHVARAGHKTKDGLQDLQKAAWYLDRGFGFYQRQKRCACGAHGKRLA